MGRPHPPGLLHSHVFRYTVSDMQAWRSWGGQKGGAEKAHYTATSAVRREKLSAALGPKEMGVGATDMHAGAPAIFRISMANVRGPEVRAW